MQNRISSFAPLIDDHSEIIILGSIPGVKSLEKQQYYAHPQNKFWKIIFELLHEEFTEDYEERIGILKNGTILLFGMSSIPVKEKEALIPRSEMKNPIRLPNYWMSIPISELFSVTAENLTKICRNC